MSDDEGSAAEIVTIRFCAAKPLRATATSYEPLRRFRTASGVTPRRSPLIDTCAPDGVERIRIRP